MKHKLSILALVIIAGGILLPICRDTVHAQNGAVVISGSANPSNAYDFLTTPVQTISLTGTGIPSTQISVPAAGFYWTSGAGNTLYAASNGAWVPVLTSVSGVVTFDGGNVVISGTYTSPNGVYSANQGSLYLGATTAYLKTSGTGNTGWAPLLTGTGS